MSSNICPENNSTDLKGEKYIDCIIDNDTTNPSVDEKVVFTQQNIVAVSLGVTVLLLTSALVAAICQIRRRGKMKRAKLAIIDDKEAQEPLEPTENIPNMSRLQLIQEGVLQRGKLIGSGAFGSVYCGTWSSAGENIELAVAIKVLQSGCNHSNLDLLEEARVMASVAHPCCVSIVAVCMTQQMSLITELMPLGCLLDYVRSKSATIGSETLLTWCVQMSCGMHHLQTLGIVHRDLAARNVLVQSLNQVKITDFGLAKLLDSNTQQYYIACEEKMPIKWLAIESLQYLIYTHKTDVWAFGVTLWEMFTFGAIPYGENNQSDLLRFVAEGHRLAKPSICSTEAYMVMLRCWMFNPDCRPTFHELIDVFKQMKERPETYLNVQLRQKTNDNIEESTSYSQLYSARNHAAAARVRHTVSDSEATGLIPESAENHNTVPDYLQPASLTIQT